MIWITEKVQIPEDEYELSFARSSGPGGQNVNKVSSKTTLKWNIDNTQSLRIEVIARFREMFGNRINNDGMVVVQSDKFRDQPRNIEDCKSKLAKMIEEVLTPPKKRKPTKPSRAQKEQRLDQKKKNAEKKKNRSWKY